MRSSAQPIDEGACVVGLPMMVGLADIYPLVGRNVDFDR